MLPHPMPVLLGGFYLAFRVRGAGIQGCSTAEQRQFHSDTVLVADVAISFLGAGHRMMACNPSVSTEFRAIFCSLGACAGSKPCTTDQEPCQHGCVRLGSTWDQHTEEDKRMKTYIFNISLEPDTARALCRALEHDGFTFGRQRSSH